jgi:putative ATPase
LDALQAEDIEVALRHALDDQERGLGALGLRVDPDALATIAAAADGDVRRALTLLEIAAELADGGLIDQASLAQVLADRTRRFDKQGEQFYDQISALHKSVRSSDPDAALYWLARMIDGGCDPAYLCRRLTRMAVEDIGLADPRALDMAISSWEAFERMGAPEGELALAQLTLYLASCAKSNAGYVAWKAVRAEVQASGTLAVPMHLRNAPTRLMKDLGYGKQYQYDPDVDGGVALDQVCLPDELVGRQFYAPVARGMEIKLKEKLDALREARRQARAKG